MARNYSTDGTENYRPPQVSLVNGVAIQESDIEVHRFLIGDVEDPDILAGFKLAEWEATESAKWIRDHCIGNLYWISGASPDSYSVCYRVVARLTDQDQTFFELKYR